MNQGKFNTILVAALIAVVLGGAYMLSGYNPTFNINSPADDGKPSDSIAGGAGVGYATTLSTAARNANTGASIATARTAVLPLSGSTWYVENASTAISSAAPNSYNGYMMIGSDTNQMSDGGTQYYIRKIAFSYSGVGTYAIQDTDGSPKVALHPEATSLTFTGYDDGAAEATLNVTVGTSIVDSAEIKIAPAAGTTFGNPDFANPVGVCINESTAGTFKSITPVGNLGKFAAPDLYSGQNIIGCYILDTPAISDGLAGTKDVTGKSLPANYRFSLSIDPRNNPSDSMTAIVIPMDKVWYIDDYGVWQAGFADDSDKGTDYDPGMSGTANVKIVYFG